LCLFLSRLSSSPSPSPLPSSPHHPSPCFSPRRAPYLAIEGLQA
jgi:hypothetical protein